MVKRILMGIIILVVFVALSQFSASAGENQRGIFIEPFGGIFYVNAPDVNFGGGYTDDSNRDYLGGEHKEDGEADGGIFGLTFGKRFKSPLSLGRNNRLELSGFYSNAESSSSATIQRPGSEDSGFTQIDASHTFSTGANTLVSINSEAEYYGFSLVLKGDNKIGLNWTVSPYIGPTLFFFEQEIDISGQFDEPEHETTSVREDTETMYLGITGGADFTRRISDRVSLVANAELSVVHARSDFDGWQETYSKGTLYATSHVTDSDEEVAVRGIGNIKLQFDIEFGTLSLGAGLHWLSYVPGVVNPRNSSYASTLDRPAHIEDESSLIIIGMAQVAIPF